MPLTEYEEGLCMFYGSLETADQIFERDYDIWLQEQEEAHDQYLLSLEEGYTQY